MQNCISDWTQPFLKQVYSNLYQGPVTLASPWAPKHTMLWKPKTIASCQSQLLWFSTRCLIVKLEAEMVLTTVVADANWDSCDSSSLCLQMFLHWDREARLGVCKVPAISWPFWLESLLAQRSWPHSSSGAYILLYKWPLKFQLETVLFPLPTLDSGGALLRAVEHFPVSSGRSNRVYNFICPGPWLWHESF